MKIDEQALEAARLAVEDELIDMRDRGMWLTNAQGGPNNGFVCRNYDGTDSSVIRFSTRHGLKIALKAYFEALNNEGVIR